MLHAYDKRQSVEVPVPHNFAMAAHCGCNRFDDSSGNYEDYSVGSSKEYMGFGFYLSWVSCADEDACSVSFQCGDAGVFKVS